MDAIQRYTAIHQKTMIGRLSAYCGAISAGCAAGCGVAYLLGEDLETISQTLSNSLAITSGVICDGAKASCAAKIATAVASIKSVSSSQLGDLVIACISNGDNQSVKKIMSKVSETKGDMIIDYVDEVDAVASQALEKILKK